MSLQWKSDLFRTKSFALVSSDQRSSSQHCHTFTQCLTEVPVWVTVTVDGRTTRDWRILATTKGNTELVALFTELGRVERPFYRHYLWDDVNDDAVVGNRFWEADTKKYGISSSSRNFCISRFWQLFMRSKITFLFFSVFFFFLDEKLCHY